MKLRDSIFFLFSITLFFSGCSPEKEETPLVVAEIGKEFSLEMRETLDSSGREFLLRAKTTKEYDCSNYSIQHIWRFQGNSMLLSLLRIAAPFICDYKPQKISTVASAGVLSEGVYAFSIDLRGAVINRGTLSVLPDRYRLQMETEHGIFLEYKELLKVPTNALWGYIAYEPAFHNQALELAQELFALCQPMNLSKGNYGYYKIEEKGLSIDGQPEDAYNYPLLRQSPENTGVLSTVLQKYRNRYPNSLRIVLKDGKGRNF